jgi:hypothetical protein
MNRARNFGPSPSILSLTGRGKTRRPFSHSPHQSPSPRATAEREKSLDAGPCPAAEVEEPAHGSSHPGQPLSSRHATILTMTPSPTRTNALPCGTGLLTMCAQHSQTARVPAQRQIISGPPQLIPSQPAARKRRNAGDANIHSLDNIAKKKRR